MSAKKGTFPQNLCPPFFGIIFFNGRIRFINTITAYRPAAFQLICIKFYTQKNRHSDTSCGQMA